MCSQLFHLCVSGKLIKRISLAVPINRWFNIETQAGYVLLVTICHVGQQSISHVYDSVVKTIHFSHNWISLYKYSR